MKNNLEGESWAKIYSNNDRIITTGTLWQSHTFSLLFPFLFGKIKNDSITGIEFKGGIEGLTIFAFETLDNSRFARRQQIGDLHFGQSQALLSVTAMLVFSSSVVIWRV